MSAASARACEKRRDCNSDRRGTFGKLTAVGRVFETDANALVKTSGCVVLRIQGNSWIIFLLIMAAIFWLYRLGKVICNVLSYWEIRQFYRKALKISMVSAATRLSVHRTLYTDIMPLGSFDETCSCVKIIPTC